MQLHCLVISACIPVVCISCWCLAIFLMSFSFLLSFDIQSEFLKLIFPPLDLMKFSFTVLLSIFLTLPSAVTNFLIFVVLTLFLVFQVSYFYVHDFSFLVYFNNFACHYPVCACHSSEVSSLFIIDLKIHA